MIFGMAPLVSVTIALLFLNEPVSAPLLAGAVLVVAGGVLLARERDRPEHLNRLGLVFAFAGATLFAIRDNLVRHLAVGKTRGAAGSRRRCRAARRDGAHRRLGAAEESAAAGSPSSRPASSSAAPTSRSSRRTTAAA